MAHNTTVQLGGAAFLVCRVAGADRVGVSWVCCYALLMQWMYLADWMCLRIIARFLILFVKAKPNLSLPAKIKIEHFKPHAFQKVWWF
jgi:hypothetical protein